MARMVIALLGCPVLSEDDKAAEAITPGHLVDWDSSGNLVKHATAGGRAAKMFALEQDPPVKISTDSGPAIDLAYGIGDQIKVGYFSTGMRVNALVAANAPAIVKGDYLESAGNGTVRKALLTGLADLTDSSGGTANDTIESMADVATAGGATPTAAQVDTAVNGALVKIRNNFADVAAKISAILPAGAQSGALIGRALESLDNSAVGVAARLRIVIL